MRKKLYHLRLKDVLVIKQKHEKQVKKGSIEKNGFNNILLIVHYFDLIIFL